MVDGDYRMLIFCRTYFSMLSLSSANLPISSDTLDKNLSRKCRQYFGAVQFAIQYQKKRDSALNSSIWHFSSLASSDDKGIRARCLCCIYFNLRSGSHLCFISSHKVVQVFTTRVLKTVLKTASSFRPQHLSHKPGIAICHMSAAFLSRPFQRS